MLESCQLRARARIVHKVFDPKTSQHHLIFEGEYGNLILHGGRVAAHTYIYGTPAQRVAAGLGTGLNYIALSSGGTAPVATDLVLASELVANGLQRAQGSVTLPTGSGTVTIVSNEFTYTGVPPQTVQKTALFDAISAGKMAHEILFDSPRTLNLNDTLTISFFITLT